MHFAEFLLDPVRSLIREGRRTACAACGLNASDKAFCASCQADFFPTDIARCQQCAHPLPAQINDRCGQCLAHPPAFDATYACAHYGPPISTMILALKKSGKLALANAFGRLMAQRVDPQRIAGAITCPVPLAAQRLRERGFNQALEIARAFAAARGQRVRADVLARARHAKAQQQLKLSDRRRNVRGAFSVHADVRGQHIVVIDDVMTSGSTLDEIARCLKRAGALRVTGVVLARTA